MTRKQGFLVLVFSSLFYFIMKYHYLNHSSSKFDIPLITAIIYFIPFCLFLFVSYKLYLPSSNVGKKDKLLQYCVCIASFYFGSRLIIFLYELDAEGNAIRDYFIYYGEYSDVEFRIEYLIMILIVFGMFIRKVIKRLMASTNENAEL